MKRSRLRRCRDESGVALLLALGVLSLLVVLTMAFATASINAKRMSQLTDSLTKARQYSEAGLQQLISMLKTDLYDHTDLGNLYPASRVMVEGSGSWNNFNFMISARDKNDAHFMDDGLADALTYSVNGRDVVPNSLPSLSGTMSPSWIPIFEGRSINGSPVQVMAGRFSFVLLDESGKIDPNAAINPGAVAEGAEIARGERISEIGLTDLGVSSTFAGLLKSKSPGEWYSRYHIIRALNLTQAEVNDLNRVLFPFRRGDTLDRRDTLYDITQINSGTPPTPAEVVNAIPWFSNWIEFGNYPSAAPRAHGIAANLIDYCDTDYNASTDDPAAPTYWGTEKVPYFSRLTFRVHNTSDNTNNNKRTEPRLSITCMPELMNMHGDLTSYATNCYMEITLDVTWTDASGAQKNEDLLFTFNPFSPAAAEVYNDFSTNGYIWTDTGTPVISEGDDFNPDTMWTISDIRLQVQSARLFNQQNGDRWDFAQTDAATEFDLEVDDANHVIFEAINPVANFLPNEWTSRLQVSAPATASSTQWWKDYPLFIRNNKMEHLVELGNILRYEPFDSSDPGQGSRTLNLVDYKYNGDPETPGLYAEATDSIIDDMSGALEDGEGNGGDRNLIDMVRIGSSDIAERTITGRININTQRRDVLKSLFYRVPSLIYSEQTAGSRPIPQADIDTLITNILASTKLNPIAVGIYSNFRNPPIYGRLFQDDMTSLPQEAREHLLILTQQMITAEHNFFTALITAQVIRDVGGVGADMPIEVYNPTTKTTSTVQSQYGRYDLSADKIMAESKVLAVLYRNAFTNRVVVDRFHYLED